MKFYILNKFFLSNTKAKGMEPEFDSIPLVCRFTYFVSISIHF